MPRILIVEDDMDFRTLLETMVRLEGHDVFLAANGETGLAQAKNKKPDIILSDVDMPGMTGIELIRAVRGTPEIAAAYIVLITGKSGQDAKLDALRAGCDDFLEKPSTRQEILGRIEIAQKVMSVQRKLAESEERCNALADIPARVSVEMIAVDAALTAVQAAIAKKDAATLVSAVKEAREAANRAKAACDANPAPAGDSWL